MRPRPETDPRTDAPASGALSRVPVSAVPTAQDLERAAQRPLFTALTVFVTALMAGYLVVFLHHGDHFLAAMIGLVLLFVPVTTAWAWRRGQFAGPLRGLSSVIFVALGIVTLQQGPALPAAGWWLSVLPFILAGAGLYHLAIAAVLAFLAVFTVVSLGGPLPWLPVEASVPPWRRYLAVVGSELLALVLIMVAMRSRARVAQALEDARTAAAEAAAVKARFLANMSHEIRTPLTGIIGAAEVLDSPGLSDVQRHQLLALQRQSARTLLALVNDVLDVGKLEAGQMQLESRPADPRAIVFEANELYSLQAFAKGVELSSSCNPDVPRTVFGDRLRLRQIVDNLVSNAVKFTDKGGVHVHLSAEPAASGPAWCTLRIEVVDSGIGIAPDRLARLFEPFVQADDSVTRRFGGTGLGLSIAQELARLMGGGIEVRSTPGQGSCFALVVTLPVAPGDAPPGLPATRQDVVLACASRGLERHLKSLLHELHIDPATLPHLPSDAELDACRLLLLDAPLLSRPDGPQWLARQAAQGRRVAVLTPLGDDAVIGVPTDALLLYKPVRREALAAVLATALEAAPARAAAAPEPSDSGRSRPWHVLLVEDNPVNQVVVQAMLAELGATSVLAADGQEALDCLRDEPFDLVLMDVHMPRLDGLAATRALRAAEQHAGRRRVPVLAMTATSEAEDGQACLEAGMDGFLAKPFGLAQLREGLARHGAGARIAPLPGT
jgi:two-component system, NarL family, sensor histidine kinase BarA